MDDRFDLARFVDAQRGVHDAALREIGAGVKRSHWMWYVFPQIAGLGHSAMAQRYAVSGIEEAKAYLAHPVLGPRLREMVEALQGVPHSDASRVFGQIDAIKLRSSLTLFAYADRDRTGPFRAALDRWFGGEEDAATVARL
jgi:uncharacterized protein (DUF1810 family)